MVRVTKTHCTRGPDARKLLWLTRCKSADSVPQQISVQFPELACVCPLFAPFFGALFQAHALHWGGRIEDSDGYIPH